MTTAFPATHITTTTTTSSSDDKKLHMNKGFLRTQHGFLKIVQIFACLFAFICVMSTGFPYNSTRDADYISFVTVCGLLISGILLFLYFINAVVYFTVIPWLLIELVYNALWCFFCFVGGIVGAVFSSKQ
ncbi:CKLF-like MARVEL transmembrane domain-containing protein 4 [Armadillidium nasatum]|uniref:CKLF-like MARVEL transmembrane domain-containing protein 4 n=1 Tax=Armadillidium nasatum TaxID=96803 RepID=A0A5N5TC84_9CRUS|nr:CKLF-like MARVEL transmembrane domain-containing protein 4 [Armadillidium nasatum]